MQKLLFSVFLIALVLLSGCTSTPPTGQVTLPADNIERVAQPTGEIENLCGNEVVDSGETCLSCPSDVKCSSGQICCSGNCIKPECNSAADCDDNDKATIDGCANSGACKATCTHNEITTCADGDGVCPASCNVFNDNDCKALAPGTPTDAGNLKMTVSNPHIEICTSEYSEDRDTYLVFNVSVENKGAKEEYISSMEFTAVDPNRKQFEGSLIPYPFVFGGNCENAKDSAFKGGNLLPGSKDNGKIWIELSSTGDYTKGKWYIFHKKTYSLEDVYTVYEAQISNQETNTPITCIMGKTLQNNVCVACGGEGQPVCSSSGCNFGYESINGACTAKCGFYQTRQNGTCVDCGGENQIPCDDGCRFGYEQINGICLEKCFEGFEMRQNNVCVSCGNVDEPCCENNECYLGICIDGVCKGPF